MSRESDISSAMTRPAPAPRRPATPLRRVARVALTLLGAAALVLLTPAAGSPTLATEQGAEPRNALYEEVEDAATAVGRWLSRNFSAQRAEKLAEQARDAATDVIRDILSGAHSAVGARLGLSVFAPGDSSGGPAAEEETGETTADWMRVDAQVELPNRAVVLVHGLDEPGSIWRDLAPMAHDRGHTIVRFDYPNDQAIAKSADQLAAAMAQLRGLGVKRLDLVCHSMGGLVARDALTRHLNGDTDGFGADVAFPDVERFIMVGTPNQGAPLARLRVVTEAREHLARWLGGEQPGDDHPLAFLADGAGQAGDDLRPGSEFLTDLNARPLPAGVDMTIIAGALAPSDGGRLATFLESSAARRLLGQRADSLAEEVRALASTVGDGVVPLESARLSGVRDMVELEANHRSMLTTLAPGRAAAAITGDNPPTPPAIPIILDRLESPTPSQ